MKYFIEYDGDDGWSADEVGDPEKNIYDTYEEANAAMQCAIETRSYLPSPERFRIEERHPEGPPSDGQRIIEQATMDIDGHPVHLVDFGISSCPRYHAQVNVTDACWIVDGNDFDAVCRDARVHVAKLREQELSNG